MTRNPPQARAAIIAAVYLVLLDDGRVLMARRINTGYADGRYSLVAGHVEAGESLTEAMIREAREEAGIILDAADLTMAHTLHRPTNGRLDFFFTASAWRGEIEIQEPERCDDLSWFPVEELPSTTLPYVREAVEHVKNRVSYSESV